MPFCVIIVSRIVNINKIKFKSISDQIELKIGMKYLWCYSSIPQILSQI